MKNQKLSESCAYHSLIRSGSGAVAGGATKPGGHRERAAVATAIGVRCPTVPHSVGVGVVVVAAAAAAVVASFAEVDLFVTRVAGWSCHRCYLVDYLRAHQGWPIKKTEGTNVNIIFLSTMDGR